MGKKKKNSNYVTEKTQKAKADAIKAKRVARNKRIALVSVSLVVAVALLVGGIILIANSLKNPNADFEVTHHASIEVEGYGTIHVELFGKEAPETVGNFVKLAQEGFYNGLTFHRVMKDFMIQGGCPNGNGTGGYEVDGKEQNIKGEFKANGVDNDIKHIRGTISMARGNGYNSASSQFFIVQTTSKNNTKSLDNNYASFGMVTSGMDIVDKIVEDMRDKGYSESVAKGDQPVIKSISIHTSH